MLATLGLLSWQQSTKAVAAALFDLVRSLGHGVTMVVYSSL